jgi:tetratricopeptide (TPR) repeat protein
MLFDLRGSGRRRVIKVVYVTLAFLMGGGLVLFGIGGGGALSGGLVDAITQSDGGGDGTDRFREAEQKANAAVRANPKDATLWAAAARARFNLASTGENVDQSSGEFTDAGKRQLRDAGAAWEEHLKLAGEDPDSRVASLMVQCYSVLGEYDKAAVAQEVIALDRGSVGAYTQLAILAYQAGQLRKGDLAKDKALELTEPDMREALKGQLESARAQAAAEAGTATPTPTPTPKPTDEK